MPVEGADEEDEESDDDDGSVSSDDDSVPDWGVELAEKIKEVADNNFTALNMVKGTWALEQKVMDERLAAMEALAEKRHKETMQMLEVLLAAKKQNIE